MSDLTVFRSEDLQNTLLLLSSGKAPLDDVRVRQSLMQSVDKSSLTRSVLGGFERPLDNVFSLDTPNCNVDMTPRWDYGLEKALFFNCPATEEALTGSGNTENSGTNKGLALGFGLGLGVPFLTVEVAAIVFFRRRSKAEQELFLLRNKVEAVNY
jgi:hypothetical protein